MILFVLPVIQMLLFGFVITNEIKDVRVSILDKSNDEITRRISEKISQSKYFIIDGYLNSDQEITKKFKSGSSKEVIVFEPDFSRKLHASGTASIHLIADASDANTANLVVSYTSAIIQSFMKDYNKALPLAGNISFETTMLYNPELKGAYMFVPGTMALILILICAMLTSVSIVREKELGTMEVLLVSPLKPFHIISGKVLPYVILSCINVATILLLSSFVFGLPIKGNIFLLISESMLFIFLALSLGIFISTSTNSQQTAMLLSMVGLMMPTILLSGFIYPPENMPIWIRWICYINPSTYFIIIIKNIMLKGLGFFSVWKETLILTAMTIFFFIMSIKKFKTRLE